MPELIKLTAHLKGPLTPKKMVMAVAVIEPLLTIPQINEVWIKHRTSGVSALSWGLFAVASSVWLVYGLKIKDVPIITGSILFVVTEFAVALGVLVN